jgi:colanic acid/amylovoran biosynthesis glycosyltransferase
MRIGYLIPEFPGQTHAFFWREIKELERLEVEVQLISTQLPPADIVCHEWSAQAIARTRYLMPLGISGFLAGMVAVFSAGPKRILKCIQLSLVASDANWKQRIIAIAMLPVAGRLLRILREQECCHLHSHSCAKSALLAMFAGVLGDITYSMTLHGPLSIYGSHQRAKWQHALFGIVVNRLIQREVLQHCPQVDPERLVVAPMGVDVGVFQKATPYQPPRAGEPWRLVTCGRLHRGKGHQDTIEAMALLTDHGQSVHLTILGEGPERSNLERLIDERKLEEHVTLSGAVSETIVRESLASAHLFVLGSHDEAIGVATMEAMAMGLPVVVTDVGGVHELVRDQVDGRLVPPRDPQAMADAISKTFATPGTARNRGQAGLGRIREHFGSDRSAVLLVERIRNVANSTVEPSASLGASE